MTETASRAIEIALPDIIRGAATLREVMSRSGAGPSSDSADKSERILDQWARIATHGSRVMLRKLLEWRGWTEEQVAGCVDCPATDPPAWASVLGDLMSEAASGSAEPIDPARTVEDPMPFEDLWFPALRLARRNLAAIKHLPMRRLSAGAQSALLRSLLNRLVFLGSQVLAHEFDVFRPESVTLLARWLCGRSQEAATGHYERFIQYFRDDGYVRLFLAYPSLGRLAAEVIEQWLANADRFLRHLDGDFELLEKVFHEGRMLGEVTHLDPDLSDPHEGGRMVHGLRFASGLRLVYKPKGLGLESALSKVLGWCNQRADVLPFKVPTVMDRGDHGWVEFVPWLPLEDKSAARRFYRRAGQLLCVIDLLRGTDCHFQNVVASGEHLVLVDGEALAHPEPGDELRGESAGISARRHLAESVARTNLLPCWEFSVDGHFSRDVSGLGSVTNQCSLTHGPRWHQVNTDHMILVHELNVEPATTNVPMLGDCPLDPHDFLEEITAGFESMYRQFLEHRSELLDSATPLSPFADQPVRFIYRTTQIYLEILYRSFSPECLADGLVRSFHLDVLCRPHLSGRCPAVWPVIEREIEALEALDVPAFHGRTSHRDLILAPGVALVNAFESASCQDIRARLANLGPGDLARQHAIIRASFLARNWRPTHVAADPPSLPEVMPQPLQSEELVAEAIAIATTIESHAIHDELGGISWLSLSFHPMAERYHLQPAPLHLYDGGLGVAQFLALLGSETGQKHWSDLARAALRPVLRELHLPRAKLVSWAESVGIGAALGIASLIHGLARVAGRLEEPSLLHEAIELAQLLTPGLIAQDGNYDVMSGSAGAILGLLTLHEATGNSSCLEQAEQCGEHLLAHRCPGADGTQVWRTVAPAPLTGFSHGAAGIGYALMRLSKATGDDKFCEAACSAVAFERALFVPAARNWPDFRPSAIESGSTLDAMGWCHGAPGIGLARVGAWDIFHDEFTKQEVDIALEAAQRASLNGVDHLCCGCFGRMDLMVEASLRFQDAGLLKFARQQAAGAIARARQQGGCAILPGWPTPALCCGLFRGYSGIGYELLRLAAPSRVPSVLLWQ